MLRIEYTKQFKKDYKLALKRGFNRNDLVKVISQLSKEEPLPGKNRDHQLLNTRNYKGMRECHINPDWLLIYKIYSEESLLKLFRTGTHSDLFI